MAKRAAGLFLLGAKIYLPGSNSWADAFFNCAMISESSPTPARTPLTLPSLSMKTFMGHRPNDPVRATINGKSVGFELRQLTAASAGSFRSTSTIATSSSRILARMRVS